MSQQVSLYGRAHVSAWLDPEVRVALGVVAKRADRSVSEEIRRAVARHLLIESMKTAHASPEFRFAVRTTRP
jgi:hypothetical protein